MEKGPNNRTKLAGSSEISYNKFMQYLAWMCQKNLIKEENGLVIVMEEGIRTYNMLVDWILKHVGKLMFRR
jgi:predicted transcriptional regulator